MKIILSLTLLICLFLVGGADADTTAYVINTGSETLSRIDLSTGAVTPNVLSLGSDIEGAPNQIVTFGNTAFVVMSVTDEIQVIDLISETTDGYVDLPVGSNPYWMDIYDGQYLYVSLMINNSVAKVDYTTKTVVEEIPVGKSPEGVVVANHKVYVANSGFDWGTFMYDPGTVSVIDITGHSTPTTIPVGLNPQYCALDNDGFIHVVCTGDYFSVFGMIYVIDPSVDAVIDSLSIGGSPGQISIGPDDHAYVAAGGWVTDGYVLSYNTATGEIYHDGGSPMAVDSGCIAVTAFQDSTLYVSSLGDTVQVVNDDGTGLHRYAVGDGPTGVDFNYVTGDLNGDFAVDISDLTYMVNYLFVTFEQPRWPTWRANTSGDFAVDISDLTALVNHLFVTMEPLSPSPRWIRP